jgi:hypothetical protein
MKIRDAVPGDADAACAVLRRSIAELCAADHHDDAVIMDRWLANKTQEIVASWIGKPDHSMLVAVEGAEILAVGAVTNGGEITLNYVSPDARFRGVSRAMLRASRAREGKFRMHPFEHRHRAALLSRRRISTDRRIDGQIRHTVIPSDGAPPDVVVTRADRSAEISTLVCFPPPIC